MSDITDLITVLGGDSHVPAFYDARAGNGITLDGGGKYATQDDARGPSGYGPQRVGFGSTKPNVVSDEIICEGSVPNYYATAADPIFDLSQQKTVIWIGTPWSFGQQYWSIQDVPLTQWDSLVSVGTGGDASTYRVTSTSVGDGTVTGKTTRLAPGDTRRMWVLNYGGTSTDPNGGDNPKWVRGHSRVPSGINDSTNNGPGGDKYLSVGRQLDRDLYSWTKERAMIVVDHPLSVAEYNAVAAWASTYHGIVEDVGPPCIVCDGNSLTEGFATSDPATKAFPALVAAAFPGYDVLNAGVGGRTGATQLAVLPTRIQPLYNAARGINATTHWEGINDLYHGSLSGAAAYANTRDACLALKAQGWKVIVLSCITGVWITSIGDTDRQTYNGLIRANWPTFAHAHADVDQLFPDYTDGTLFYSDQIHLIDAGQDLVANDPTYGVIAAINRVLTASSPGGAAMNYYSQLRG